jgi:LysR family glycine cleavage system transcriptional activator
MHNWINFSVFAKLQVMNKFRRILPSLDALVFFEAAARHNSFTRAAGELYVTQAAVSKRIRELEARLGLDLFRRDGRLLSLTRDGHRFYERVGTALEFLDDACRQAAGEHTETVRIAANSAVSLLWLPPRLKRFGLGEQAVNVNLATSDRLADTLDPDNDLVVAYGNGEIPGWHTELLFLEKLVPVAAPGYLANIGNGDESAGLEFNTLPTLLEYQRLAPDWINWKTWIERTGSEEFRTCPTRSCRTYAQAIGAALEGKGLALGSRGLLDAELNSNQLRVVGEHELVSGKGYYLAHPARRKPESGAKALRNFLIDFNTGH